MFFISLRVWDKEKFCVPMRTRYLIGTHREFFFGSMLTTRQKTSFFILCPKFVFIVFILLSSLFYGGNSLHVPKMVEKKYTQKVVIGFGVFAWAVFILF